MEQFESDDRAGAEILLDAVRFVDGGNVVAGIRTLIERSITNAPSRTPVALLPVLSTEDMEPIPGVEKPESPTVFWNFDPNQKLSNTPGSEALVSHLITEIAKSSFRKLLVSAPLSRDKLRDTQARRIVCVTDYIGSGQQVIDYIKTWQRHISIRSWRSYNLIKIDVVAYAATTSGIHALKRSGLVDDVQVVEIAPGIEYLRLLDPSGSALQVARLYARRHKLGEALGYRESCGFFASSFSVPNNLPSILIRRRKTWEPFFDGRSVPGALAEEIGDYRRDLSLTSLLEQSGQTRLAARQRAGHVDERWDLLLTMLALLPRQDEQLSVELGIDVQEVQKMRASLMRLKLVADNGSPSTAGHRTLAVHRRKPRSSSGRLTGDSSNYYPRYRS